MKIMDDLTLKLTNGMTIEFCGELTWKYRILVVWESIEILLFALFGYEICGLVEEE
jgi:hypothetical protein